MKQVSNDPPARIGFSRQVPLEQIGLWYHNVGRSLIEQGIAPAVAADLLETSVSAHCSQCGVLIRGAELAQAALTELNGRANAARIGRLSHGYCPRQDCPSHFCDLLFAARDHLDWASVCGAAERLSPSPARGQSQALRPSRLLWRSLEARLSRRQMIGALTVGSVCALALYYTLRTPAWSRRSSRYRAEPASSYRAPPPPAP
jgi:hypothetical protein